VFKVSAFRLDTCAQTGALLSDCRINITLIKYRVTSRWERRYTVKAVHMVDNSGSNSRSIISCLGPEIFVQINRLMSKFCPMKDRGSGNYDTPCIYNTAFTPSSKSRKYIANYLTSFPSQLNYKNDNFSKLQSTHWK